MLDGRVQMYIYIHKEGILHVFHVSDFISNPVHNHLTIHITVINGAIFIIIT
jgi:hypothetical protein